jgi:hypothetical protein
VTATIIKEGLHWAWKLVRRDLFASVFIAAGENLQDALKMSRTLDQALDDLEAAEAGVTIPDAGQ